QNRAISATRSKPLAIQRESQGEDRAFVPPQATTLSAASRLPQMNTALTVGHGQGPAVRREGQGQPVHVPGPARTVDDLGSGINADAYSLIQVNAPKLN